MDARRRELAIDERGAMAERGIRVDDALHELRSRGRRCGNDCADKGGKRGGRTGDAIVSGRHGPGFRLARVSPA
jgi:hypothetical protein